MSLRIDCRGKRIIPLSLFCFSFVCPEMPCFARVFEHFVIYSEMTECGKSKQGLASCYYLLVVKLVVKEKELLLRINLLLNRQQEDGLTKRFLYFLVILQPPELK